MKFDIQILLSFEGWKNENQKQMFSRFKSVGDPSTFKPIQIQWLKTGFCLFLSESRIMKKRIKKIKKWKRFKWWSFSSNIFYPTNVDASANITFIHFLPLLNPHSWWWSCNHSLHGLWRSHWVSLCWFRFQMFEDEDEFCVCIWSSLSLQNVCFMIWLNKRGKQYIENLFPFSLLEIIIWGADGEWRRGVLWWGLNYTFKWIKKIKPFASSLQQHQLQLFSTSLLLLQKQFPFQILCPSSCLWF